MNHRPSDVQHVALALFNVWRRSMGWPAAKTILHNEAFWVSHATAALDAREQLWETRGHGVRTVDGTSVKVTVKRRKRQR